ncbi:hypothetical protein HDU76_000553 [Blyttiomyces sp. JEL0837]|nr:hypothetical protein HDU76_000553 [Blyttiomyces sp. JEL0837]
MPTVFAGRSSSSMASSTPSSSTSTNRQQQSPSRSQTPNETTTRNDPLHHLNLDAPTFPRRNRHNTTSPTLQSAPTTTSPWDRQTPNLYDDFDDEAPPSYASLHPQQTTTTAAAASTQSQSTHYQHQHQTLHYRSLSGSTMLPSSSRSRPPLVPIVHSHSTNPSSSSNPQQETSTVPSPTPFIVNTPTSPHPSSTSQQQQQHAITKSLSITPLSRCLNLLHGLPGVTSTISIKGTIKLSLIRGLERTKYRFGMVFVRLVGVERVHLNANVGRGDREFGLGDVAGWCCCFGESQEASTEEEDELLLMMGVNGVSGGHRNAMAMPQTAGTPSMFGDDEDTDDVGFFEVGSPFRWRYGSSSSTFGNGSSRRSIRSGLTNSTNVGSSGLRFHGHQGHSQALTPPPPAMNARVGGVGGVAPRRSSSMPSPYLGYAAASGDNRYCACGHLQSGKGGSNSTTSGNGGVLKSSPVLDATGCVSASGLSAVVLDKRVLVKKWSGSGGGGGEADDELLRAGDHEFEFSIDGLPSDLAGTFHAEHASRRYVLEVLFVVDPVVVASSGTKVPASPTRGGKQPVTPSSTTHLELHRHHYRLSAYTSVEVPIPRIHPTLVRPVVEERRGREVAPIGHPGAKEGYFTYVPDRVAAEGNVVQSPLLVGLSPAAEGQQSVWMGGELASESHGGKGKLVGVVDDPNSNPDDSDEFKTSPQSMVGLGIDTSPDNYAANTPPSPNLASSSTMATPNLVPLPSPATPPATAAATTPNEMQEREVDMTDRYPPVVISNHGSTDPVRFTAILTSPSVKFGTRLPILLHLSHVASKFKVLGIDVVLVQVFEVFGGSHVVGGNSVSGGASGGLIGLGVSGAGLSGFMKASGNAGSSNTGGGLASASVVSLASMVSSNISGMSGGSTYSGFVGVKRYETVLGSMTDLQKTTGDFFKKTLKVGCRETWDAVATPAPFTGQQGVNADGMMENGQPFLAGTARISLRHEIRGTWIVQVQSGVGVGGHHHGGDVASGGASASGGAASGYVRRELEAFRVPVVVHGLSDEALGIVGGLAGCSTGSVGSTGGGSVGSVGVEEEVWRERLQRIRFRVKSVVW